MIESLLQIVAPHHCYGCGEIGTLLCDNCKYNIVDERYTACIVCRMPEASQGVCRACMATYTRAWVVAERSDEIEQVLNGYKFMRQKAGAKSAAALLDDVLPSFIGMNVVIVPVPTISAHIRRRGYDHMALVARNFARQRKLSYSPQLIRRSNSVQLGSSKRQRFLNAKNAFAVKGSLDPEAVYLVVDDVVTTGATLRFAAQALLDAGASTVWAATIARQPLDK